MEVKFIRKNEGQTLRIRLIANKSEKAEIRETLEKNGSDFTFFDLTETFWTNGWNVTTADHLYQMSECLVISENGSIEDDASITLYGKSWTNIHNYQVVCPVQEMLDTGFVDFYFWEDFGDGQTFPNPYLSTK